MLWASQRVSWELCTLRQGTKPHADLSCLSLGPTNNTSEFCYLLLSFLDLSKCICSPTLERLNSQPQQKCVIFPIFSNDETEVQRGALGHVVVSGRAMDWSASSLKSQKLGGALRFQPQRLTMGPRFFILFPAPPLIFVPGVMSNPPVTGHSTFVSTNLRLFLLATFLLLQTRISVLLPCDVKVNDETSPCGRGWNPQAFISFIAFTGGEGRI